MAFLAEHEKKTPNKCLAKCLLAFVVALKQFSYSFSYFRRCLWNSSSGNVYDEISKASSRWEIASWEGELTDWPREGRRRDRNAMMRNSRRCKKKATKGIVRPFLLHKILGAESLSHPSSFFTFFRWKERWWKAEITCRAYLRSASHLSAPHPIAFVRLFRESPVCNYPF